MRVYMRFHTMLGPRTIVMSGLTKENATAIAEAGSFDGEATVVDEGPSFTYQQWRSKNKPPAKVIKFSRKEACS